jgi:DNA repair exonuclease SbcCD ATPase subunit
LSRFDFDAWRDLAVRDPAEYFRERERALSAFIAERPESERDLRELQVQIDQVRALSGSPAKAARELARMLGDRLEALSGHLRQLDEQTGALKTILARRGS